jgi:predicted TIM-barrel fold metal-dependent hydrolase
MPLQPWMKMISVDDHLIEHANVWQDRLPQRLRDAGPRIVEEPREDGPSAEVWHYEGRRYPTIGLNAVAGKRYEDYGTDPIRFTDMIPGCYDPRARLQDMDVDGVWAGLNFPSFARFSGTVFLEGTDTELAELCIRAYNDYVLDEWCAVDPERLIPVVLLPVWDVEASIREVERTAAKGAKAISFPENPVPLGLPSFHTDHWDPLLDAVEASGMPLTMHFGSSGNAPTTAPEAPFAVTITLFGTNSMAAVVDLLYSPVFHRHPNLKIGFSEGGIGWVPYILERADFVWNRHRFYQNVHQTVKPSELFAKHVHGCFISDEHGIWARDRIGIDTLTWECDYPHSDSNWPHSRKMAAEAFVDVPDVDVHKIVELNARRLYNLSPAAAPPA